MIVYGKRRKQMNKIQQMIADYYALSKEELAEEVFLFHMEQVQRYGCRIKGCLGSGLWGVVDTAHSFNISKGMVSQLLQRHRAKLNGERSKY